MLARHVAVLALLAGCPSSAGPAARLQQAPPTVAAAEGAKAPVIEACTPPKSADLMVVDWTPETRGDLEVAMKEGLALLAYDCKSARLVAGCSLEGGYAYIGTTRRTKKIEMTTSDEVAANLPISGLSWMTEIGGKFARDTGLLAELVMVGKRSSAKKTAQRAELTGACDGVTHFVRAATVGAFAVASGSKAELGATATLMGKGASGDSKSATKLESHDGSLAACETSTPDGTTPPAECGAIMRIELEPIGGAATATAAPELAVASCAPGFVVADGVCVRPDKPHQCDPADAADCATQCDAGDAGSCATLAALDRSSDKATAYAQKACDADNMLGCRVLASIKLAGKGKTKAEGLALLDRACQAGDGRGCVELGVARLDDKKAAGDAQYAFRRACYGGGEHEGCAWLGTLYAEGKGGLSVSPKVAAKFFDKGCRDGSQRACTGYADLLAKGAGVDKDAARAKELYTAACAAGFEPACKKQ
jgi:uncharacterized protein